MLLCCILEVWTSKFILHKLLILVILFFLFCNLLSGFILSYFYYAFHHYTVWIKEWIVNFNIGEILLFPILHPSTWDSLLKYNQDKKNEMSACDCVLLVFVMLITWNKVFNFSQNLFIYGVSKLCSISSKIKKIWLFQWSYTLATWPYNVYTVYKCTMIRERE